MTYMKCMFCPINCRTKLSEEAARVESTWVWETTDQFNTLVLPLLGDFGHIA